jgi:hypothetical protein
MKLLSSPCKNTMAYNCKSHLINKLPEALIRFLRTYCLLFHDKISALEICLLNIIIIILVLAVVLRFELKFSCVHSII